MKRTGATCTEPCAVDTVARKSEGAGPHRHQLGPLCSKLPVRLAPVSTSTPRTCAVERSARPRNAPREWRHRQRCRWGRFGRVKCAERPGSGVRRPSASSRETTMHLSPKELAGMPRIGVNNRSVSPRRSKEILKVTEFNEQVLPSEKLTRVLKRSID